MLCTGRVSGPAYGSEKSTIEPCRGFRLKSQPLNLYWFPTRVIICLPTSPQLYRGKHPIQVDSDGSPVMLSAGGLILVRKLDGPLDLGETD